MTVTTLSSCALKYLDFAVEFVHDRARVGTERQELMRMSAAFTVVCLLYDRESALMEPWLSPQQANGTKQNS